MPAKPTISPTKITTYLACPVRFRWTYLDRRGKPYLRAKSYFSFGSSLHRVLERFHDEGDVGVSGIDDVLTAYEESWIDAGYNSAEEMAESFGEGRDILERYVREHALKPAEAKTLFVEKQFRQDFGEFVLLGRVDRVDEYPDGTLEIVDYKSGREAVEADQVANDVAMGCYQLLLRHKFPGRPVRARIHALRSGTSAIASFTDEEAAAFEADVRQIGLEIVTEDFYERKPVMKPICAHCDFLPLCLEDRDASGF